MDDTLLSESTSKHWRYLLLAIVVLMVVYAVTGSNWVFIFLAPLVLLVIYGTASGRAIVGGISFISQHASERAIGEWQGNYYKWGNRQIRILEAGHDVWVVDEDLLFAAGMKPNSSLLRKLKISYPGYRNIPGTRFNGFNERAVLAFLAGKQGNDPEIIKLKLWFERGVYFPLRRKNGS